MRLRYSLGGYRPSKTNHAACSSVQRGSGLRVGISLLLSTLPLSPSAFLPPIQSAVSQGAKGLPVYLSLPCICTWDPISLRGSLRQSQGGYAIQTLRDLSDKVLRYILTVMVTAAVYHPFFLSALPFYLPSHSSTPSSILHPGRRGRRGRRRLWSLWSALLLGFGLWHWAGVSHYSLTQSVVAMTWAFSKLSPRALLFLVFLSIFPRPSP